MPDKGSRPTSVASTSSLMQDVPGAFPIERTSRYGDDEHDEEDKEDEVAHKSLSQRVYARRAEYVRPNHVRIKVGTWNVAAFKGTEKDVGGWFVGGRGLAEHLTGVSINDSQDLEEVAEQEARYAKKQETLPKGDHGTLPQHDDVGIYVLGLQEVVDVNSASEALRPYTDPSVANKWKESMSSALPKGYQLVAEQQLIGLLLLVYAAPDVAKDVRSVSTTSVGTGLMGYMGNKGAVTARIVLGETTRLVFVNCHLAAGADKAALDRRNWDASQIISRTRFDPIQDSMDLAQTTGEQIGDEDFAFWCGDLNYRLEGIPGDDVRRLLMLHTRNEYDLSQQSSNKIEKELKNATDSVKERVGSDHSTGSSIRSSIDTRQSTDTVRSADSNSTKATTLMDEIAASEDPASLQTTLSSLLPHDELHQQMQNRKAFHDGWREGPISFLPTYKYDPGSVGVFDSSEKKRAPSWCDRILYRTRREKLAYETKVREEENARKKDEEMKANGTDQAANDEDILYDYDPDKDGAAEEYNDLEEYDDAEDGVVITREGFEDEIALEYYTAHQRVLSSDHKPLDASFMLKYDAVVPELKAKIHAEVARELDKAENEGRPDVTVVVDKHNDIPESSDDSPADKFEGVWFGDVRWAQSKNRSLTVANTSRVPSSFTFIERPVDESQTPGVAPRWLTLKVNDETIKSSSAVSDSITLEPGETCSVELELRIMGMDDVRALNDSQRSLEDILVLRVENGRDHFIPIRGNWQESSLGRTIDKLVRIPEGGIRKLQRQKPDSGKSKMAVAANTISAATTLGQNAGGNASSPAVLLDEQLEDDPVRFSAPRELFRLTEAVEELSTRFVADWEMTNPSPHSPSRDFSESLPSLSAPWDEHPAWPFDEECWTEQNTSHFEQALSEAVNALDEDQPLDANLPSDLPRLQRLYVLCSLLLFFLSGMPDGIIPTDLWPAVEGYLNECEKAKRKPSIDDQRTTIQEALALSPSHSISFILITSMLERMIQERVANPDTNTNNSRDDASSTSDTPMSPTKRAGGMLKRMTTGKVPQAPQREKLASAALAKIFAPAVVRAPGVNGDKAKTAQERRKVELIEIFLRRDESLV